jgi:hypothetical protein
VAVIADPVYVDTRGVVRAAGPHSPGPSLPKGEGGTWSKPSLFFSLLSLGERRAGEVRAGEAGTVRTEMND